MNNFKEKSRRLPANVQAYLLSLKGTELNGFIAKSFSIEDTLSLVDIISRLFFKELPITALPSECASKFSLSPEESLRLSLTIVGVRLLAVDSWLDGAASRFLKDNSDNPSSYQHFIDEQQSAISQEEEEWRQEEVAEAGKEISEIMEKRHKGKAVVEEDDLPVDNIQEKAAAFKNFNSNLLDILEYSDSDELDEYNRSLISRLLDDETLQANLEKALLSNQELISRQAINVGGEKRTATVENFIKDFVGHFGSDNPDRLHLAQYLNTSPNVAVISSSEKKIVRQVLKTYFNLYFFPQSLVDLDPEDYELISFDRLKTGEEKKTTLQESSVSLDDNDLNKSPENDMIKELESRLAACQPLSLEYKAISQEISRLRRFKK